MKKKKENKEKGMKKGTGGKEITNDGNESLKRGKEKMKEI